MKPTPETIKIFRSMQDNLIAMGENIKELMRHPDATPEQLWANHKMYANVWDSYKEVRIKMRERFPETGLMRVYPWNMVEKVK